MKLSLKWESKTVAFVEKGFSSLLGEIDFLLMKKTLFPNHLVISDSKKQTKAGNGLKKRAICQENDEENIIE